MGQVITEIPGQINSEIGGSNDFRKGGSDIGEIVNNENCFEVNHENRVYLVILARHYVAFRHNH